MRELSGEDLDALVDGQSGRPAAEIERDLAIPTLSRLRLVTAGPSASVFRAYQTATQRTVAVKVLHDELSSDVGQRFDRERAITGQLSGHSGIVPLLHTGTTADGEPYLVLPFYDRGSLADLMTRYGPLPWREATFLMRPVASTIAEIQLWGLVHRNLKPSNVLLTDFLRPRVADFGMCLPSGQTSTEATLVDGPYAPDEAKIVGPTDPTVDVFGLGATLWALLAGRPVPTVDGERRLSGASELPLAGSRLGRSRSPEIPGDDTPARIAELLERSMSPDPADRPATVAAFIAELGNTDLTATQPSTGQRGGPASSSTEMSTQRIQLSRDPDRSTTSSDADTDDEHAPGDPVATADQSETSPADLRDASERTTSSSLEIHSDDGTTSDGTASDGTTTDASPVVAPEAEARVVGDRSAPSHRSRVGSTAPSPARSSADPSADNTPTRERPDSLEVSRTGSDVYYLLALVALISSGIIAMIASAVLAFQ